MKLRHPVASLCRLYRVIQVERSVFWKVIIWVSVGIQVRINMCVSDTEWVYRVISFENTNK